MDLDSVLAYAIEVAQRKVLFKLFEERLDLPSSLIDGSDVLDIEVEAVRQKLDFLLLASPSGCLGFNIRNDPGPVRRAVLVKDDLLNGSFPEFSVVMQEAFGDGFIGQVLHFGYVSHATPCQFLELFIVDVGAVHGKHVAIVKVRGLQHETVVGGRGGEPDVARHALVCANDRMDLHAALFLSQLGVPADAPEYQVGE